MSADTAAPPGHRTPPPPDLFAGVLRKAHALGRHERGRDRLMLRLRRALVLAAARDGSATIEAVRAAVALPAGADPTLLGAVPGPLVKAGVLKRVGYAPTLRAAAHARPTAVWAVADPAAAADWLAANPEPGEGDHAAG